MPHLELRARDVPVPTGACFYARSISNIFFGNIEKCPFTYWLNGRWFLQIVAIGNFNIKLKWKVPQIVDRNNGNIYPIYTCIYKNIVALASEPVGGRSRETELPCFYYISVIS